MSVEFFDNILRRARLITEYYVNERGSWDLSWCLLHIHSEVSEVYEILRKRDSRTSIRNQLKEELGDVFLTIFETCHLANLSDEEIKELIMNALHKVEKRIALPVKEAV